MDSHPEQNGGSKIRDFDLNLIPPEGERILRSNEELLNEAIDFTITHSFSAVPSFLLLVFYYWTPESPRYLCLKGRKDEAFRIMEKVSKCNKKSLPPGVLFTDREIEQQTASSSDADSSGWDDSDLGLVTTLRLLLSRKLARSTILLWLIFFGNAFSYYGLVLLTTQLNRKDLCSKTPVKTADSGAGIDYQNVFITTLAECPGAILAILLVDKIGRKYSMASLLFLCCAFVLPLVVHQTSVVTTILLFGARICITGSFAIAFVLAPELYPTSVRSTGFGIASSMGRIGGITAPFVAVSLTERCRQSQAVILFIAIAAVALIAALLIPHETKGIQLTESISSTKNETQKSDLKRHLDA
ncbi:Organic cation/carnitine transporter 7 [Linum grandiflorum]